ncbi:hypothetical protein Scep_019289 [Stephania cephalantha]|uniref:Transmembrane protein n=1 Tax=Stephania cephalantha TaxID=152367 RepID=A0AAP0IAM7_9MAGN
MEASLPWPNMAANNDNPNNNNQQEQRVTHLPRALGVSLFSPVSLSFFLSSSSRFILSLSALCCFFFFLFGERDEIKIKI